MVYVRYRDDGSAHPCGQCCSVTSPRDILFKVKDRETARDLAKMIEEDTVRKNSRVDGVWSTEEEDFCQPVQGWPVNTREET